MSHIAANLRKKHLRQYINGSKSFNKLRHVARPLLARHLTSSGSPVGCRHLSLRTAVKAVKARAESSYVKARRCNSGESSQTHAGGGRQYRNENKRRRILRYRKLVKTAGDCKRYDRRRRRHHSRSPTDTFSKKLAGYQRKQRNS